VTLRIFVGEREVSRVVVPVPTGLMVELPIDLPAGSASIRTEADGPYRAMHWFALQPD
jgi:hypothetical protein